MTTDALKSLPVLLFALENESTRSLRNKVWENEDPRACERRDYPGVHRHIILGPPPTPMTNKISLYPLLNCSEKSGLIPVQSYCYKDEGTNKRGFERNKVLEHGTGPGALAFAVVRRKRIPSD